MAAAVDDLSHGRLVLGVGAGWQEREHANYGWELLNTEARFARLGEGLEVISRLLRSDAPFDYSGEYYRLKNAILLPRPARQGGPPILVGGNGEKRTLPLVARYADEWNAVYVSTERFRELAGKLDELTIAEGRQPDCVRRSLMTGCVFGLNQADLANKVEARTQAKLTAAELRRRGLLVGTAAELIEQIGKLAEAGVQRVMLQWLDLDDMAGLETLARDVLHKMR
jgi:alkanesulfonate monooxygenase SsuD/methylene tetrahydromethanopterin reductase-like flavin-dependent oxidoreductase (luciferase family)